MLAASTWSACSPTESAPGEDGAAALMGSPPTLAPDMELDSAMSDSLEQAQARVTRKVIDIEGVTGTALGLCNGRPCIKVYLESDSSTLRRRLPRSESGFPVVTEVTGKIRRP